MDDRDAPLLDTRNAAFVQQGLSMVAASCSAALVPSIARLCGCAVSADRRRVTVFLPGVQARELVADVRASGRIAAVFNEPSTHRTLQLKADDACVRKASDDELAIVTRYVGAFAEEIGPLGHSHAHARVMFAFERDDLVAIDFHPNAAFEQTPGPNAGAPLRVKP